MNKSVELIKSEIYEVKSNLQKFTDLSKKEPENEAHSFYVTYFTNRLTILQQIKSELEAWEELNELFIIKPYYQDKENNKHPAIMIQHKIEKDFEYVRRGCKQKSFDTIKKALEVEE